MALVLMLYVLYVVIMHSTFLPNTQNFNSPVVMFLVRFFQLLYQ